MEPNNFEKDIVEPIQLIPKGWVRYKDDYNDFCYNPKEYEILLDNHSKPYCHYYGDGDSPSQPIGLTDYYQLFSMYQGRQLDLSKWDTAGVTNFSKLFKSCRLLAIVKLDNWTFSDCEYAEEMFCKCSNLQVVYLEHVDFSNLISMNKMWYDCRSLEELHIKYWHLPHLQSMISFCENCISLRYVDDTGWDDLKNVNMFAAYNNCIQLKT